MIKRDSQLEQLVERLIERMREEAKRRGRRNQKTETDLPKANVMKFQPKRQTRMKKRDTEPLNIVRMNRDEAMIVIRFKRLCDKKLDGQRFQRDANYRYSAIDALLESVENLEK
jgi:hypothetical protein